MFERYTEPARRVIFQARFEAGQAGSAYIETHHLLLGVLTQDWELARTLSTPLERIDHIRTRIAAEHPAGPKKAITVDLPLSHEAKRVLAYAAEESERLRQRFIGPEHLVLGLLREDCCSGARILRDCGLDLGEFRRQVAELKEPSRAAVSGEPHVGFKVSDVHRMIDELPEERRQAAAFVLRCLAEDFVSLTVSNRSGGQTFTFGEAAAQADADQRLSDRARRALHIARSEAARAACRAVETEHLLLGVFLEDRALAVRLLGSPLEVESIRKDVQARSPEVALSQFVLDLPLSERSLRAVDFAAEEAGEHGIETAHLIFGLLRVENSVAAAILARRNIGLQVAKQRLTHHA